MVNLVGVLVAGLVAFVFGAIYHGPIFGKTWLKLVTIKPKEIDKKQMPKLFLMGFLNTLVMSYVIGFILELTLTTTLIQATNVAFLTWLGFSATVMLSQVIWEKRNTKLFMLNIGYFLIINILMALIQTYFF